MLILRDAFAGTTRFEVLQKALSIAPAKLTRRMTAYAYRLTRRGINFRPVLLTPLA